MRWTSSNKAGYHAIPDTPSASQPKTRKSSHCATARLLEFIPCTTISLAVKMKSWSTCVFLVQYWIVTYYQHVPQQLLKHTCSPTLPSKILLTVGTPWAAFVVPNHRSSLVRIRCNIPPPCHTWAVGGGSRPPRRTGRNRAVREPAAQWGGGGASAACDKTCVLCTGHPGTHRRMPH